MANKPKKKNINRNLVLGICAAVVVVIVIVLAIVLGTNNGGFGGINDSFFNSDGSKYVLTMDAEYAAFDDEKYTPAKTHFVYFYSGDKITGLKAYYEYDDEESAKAAFDYLSSNSGDTFKSILRDGKYVILEAPESEYEGLTADDVKQQIEFMESLKNVSADEEEEVVEENGDESEAAGEESAETIEIETIQE